MYFVIEIQVNKEHTGSTLVTVKDAQNEAESEYYRILQYAALSDLPVHSAIIVDDLGNPVMHQAYVHEQIEEDSDGENSNN